LSNYARRPKRIIAGVLAGALALSVTPILGFTGVASADHITVADPTGEGNFCEDVPQQEPFTDVQTSDPSYEEIVCLVATEITTGVTATTYEPNSFVTRRQMALFLVRAAEEADRLEVGDTINELPAPADTDFTDTEDEEQFIEDAISQVAQAGVAQGFPDNSYRPGAPVSRRQMAAFIDRLYEYLTGEELPATQDYFDDDDTDSAEAQESTNAVAEAGIFIGNEDDTFRPAQEITRRQMANVLTRFLQVLFEEGFITQWAAEDTTPGNDTATTRPELVSASIVQTTSQGTTVRFTFDEALTGVGVVASSFNVYTFGSTGGAADFGTNAQVVNSDTRSVLVTFPNITTASGLAGQLSLATVDEGAVIGISGNPATDSNIIGDAPLNPGTTTQLVAGQTDAPDLVSVGNFRANPANVNETLVDFTFDEAADNQFNGYELVNVDGVNSNDDGVLIAGDGTTVHTVAFGNNAGVGAESSVTITAASIARGTVWYDTVHDAANTSWNPLQSADVSAGGNTETPDLVSAVIVRNQPAPAPAPPGTMIDAILYTFDEPVIDPVAGQFSAYMSDGVTEINGAVAVRSTSNDTQVAVVFGPAGILDLAVGASVEPGAVDEGAGAQNRPNLQDEVAVANVGTGPTTTSGRTAGPDLTGVAISERRDPFGTLIGGRVVFTFDEDVFGPSSGLFSIVLADGSIYDCTDATVGTTEDTDNQVTCTGFGAATTSQILSAVVGTVDDGAVTNQAAGTGPGTGTPAGAAGPESNPEGAEVATGSTGTPAS